MLVNYYLRRFNRELGKEMREGRSGDDGTAAKYAVAGDSVSFRASANMSLLHATVSVLIPGIPSLRLNCPEKTPAGCGFFLLGGRWAAFTMFTLILRSSIG